MMNQATLSKLSKLMNIVLDDESRVYVLSCIRWTKQYGNITADMMQKCNELYKKYKYEKYYRDPIAFAKKFLYGK